MSACAPPTDTAQVLDLMIGTRQNRSPLKPTDLEVANEILSALPPYPASVPLRDLDREFGPRTSRRLLNSIDQQFKLMAWRGEHGLRIALSPAASRRVRLGFTLQQFVEPPATAGDFSNDRIRDAIAIDDE